MKKLFVSTLILFISLISFSQITFQKTYGDGTLSSEIGNSVQQTNDAGYIIAGSTQSFGAGDYDAYLIRTDYNGDILWTKTYGSTANEKAYSIQQTTDGGYIIAGYNEPRINLIRTDSIGNLLWTKKYYAPFGDDVLGYSVQQTMEGGYIISGVIVTGFGQGPSYIYLIKTDSTGNLTWTKIFDGASYLGQSSTQQTTDGGYIITGSAVISGSGDEDFYLIKTDTIGNLVWAKTYGGANNDVSWFGGQTIDGGYIIAGQTESFGLGNFDVYLIKTDSIGDTLWTKTLGTTDFEAAYCIYQTPDSGYIISGKNNSKGYLLKTDASGNPLWSKRYDAFYNDFANSVCATSDGGYIVAGYGFYPSSSEVYLIKTDSLGNSGCNQINITTIATSPPTQVITPFVTVTSGGSFFTPSIIVGSGGIDTTLCATLGIHSAIQNSQSGISIFPNPSSSNFIISFERTILKGQVEILNILGENVFLNNIFSESKKEINLKNISSGIYFVKVFDGEKSYCKKIIVE